MCPPMLEYVDSDVGVFLRIQIISYFNQIEDLLRLASSARKSWSCVSCKLGFTPNCASSHMIPFLD